MKTEEQEQLITQEAPISDNEKILCELRVMNDNIAQLLENQVYDETQRSKIAKDIRTIRNIIMFVFALSLVAVILSFFMGLPIR